MNDDERHELLQAVARGEVSPADAAARFADDDGAGSPDAGPDPRTSDERSSQGSTTDVRLVVLAGSVRVIGDPSVTTVDVSGDHSLERDGGTLTVRCEPDFDRIQLSMRSRRGGHRRRWGGDMRTAPRATVRVNPDLPLEIDADASSVDVRSMRSPITARLNAGSLRLRDVVAPFDAAIRAGLVRVDGRLTTGTSTISCEMGRAQVVLDPTSDVAVHAAVELGRVDIRSADGSPPSSAGELTLGAGAAELTIRGTMSSVDVRTPRTADAAR